jgi:Ca2+-binding EF-hand superfamily protein
VTSKRGTEEVVTNGAPAFKSSSGRYADTINRRGRGGAGEDGSGSTAGAGTRSAAAITRGGTDEGREGDTVLVRSAAGAEDLMRAEADMSSKLRKAIRGSAGGSTGPSKGKRDAGGEQVARSLAKRRQARLEMARLRSSSAFVDWLWLGNTDRPDVAYKQSMNKRGRPIVRPAGAHAPGAPGMEGGALAAGTSSDMKLIPPSAVELLTLAEVDEDSAAAAAAAAGAAAVSTEFIVPGTGDSKLGGLGADVDDPTPTGRSAVPKQWTGAGTADGVVRPMRPRRGSMGATAVDKILSDFDKEKKPSAGGGGSGGGGGGRRGRRTRNAKGVRGGGEVKRVAVGAGASGSAKAEVATKPKNEQAPEKGNVHARIAAKRRHLPDGGCARCWAISTRCCAEALELRRARLDAARQGVVLTGRSQEAVEVLGVTQGQVRTLYRQFVELDDGLEGRIHLNDFFEEFLGMPRSAVTDAIWLALVENTTGQMLGFEDFVLMVCVYCMFTEEDILRFCFSTFDINGNGDLDEDEFLQMLRIVNHEKPLFPGNFRQALDM